MIRIIKEGNYKRITCETCGAILAYNQTEDVTSRMGVLSNGVSCITSYIECPLCGHKICCGTTEYNGSIGIKESDIKTGTLSIRKEKHYVSEKV